MTNGGSSNEQVMRNYLALLEQRERQNDSQSFGEIHTEQHRAGNGSLGYLASNASALGYQPPDPTARYLANELSQAHMRDLSSNLWSTRQYAVTGTTLQSHAFGSAGRGVEHALSLHASSAHNPVASINTPRQVNLHDSSLLSTAPLMSTAPVIATAPLMSTAPVIATTPLMATAHAVPSELPYLRDWWNRNQQQQRQSEQDQRTVQRLLASEAEVLRSIRPLLSRDLYGTQSSTRPAPMLPWTDSALGHPSLLQSLRRETIMPAPTVPSPTLPVYEPPQILFPVTVSHELDTTVLSDHQVYLRKQMEVFEASPDDTHSHVRGRNKRIYEGQVGVRCRHCAHVPIQLRQLGSTYFPVSLLGFYQAAQNMCSSHIQCGKCSDITEEVKDEFIRLLALKSLTSNAGRRYWADRLSSLGLVDTDVGVFKLGNVPPGAVVIPMGSAVRSLAKRKASSVSISKKIAKSESPKREHQNSPK